MSEFNLSPALLRGATLEAVIIRADGTREELGVIARFGPLPWHTRISTFFKGLWLQWHH